MSAGNQTLPRATEYLIPRHAVDQLFEVFKVVRNELSEALAIPTTDTAEWDRYAEQWYQSNTPEDQQTIQKIVRGLGSPTLVSNASIISGNEKLINTRAVFSSTRIEDPAFLMGLDEEEANYRVQYLESGSMWAGTLLMYLDAGTEIGYTEFKLTTSIPDFVVFLAVMDLYRRSRLQALLEHEVVVPEFSIEEVWKSLEDAMMYPDMRWTLPFVMLQVPDNVPRPQQASVQPSLQNLVGKGLFTWTQEGKLGLTEPGLLVAKTLYNVYNKMSLISLGVDAQGAKGRKNVLLIRGDPLLWVIDLSNNNAVMATINLDQAADLIDEMLTTVAAPSPLPMEPVVEEVQPEPTPEPEEPKAPFCPKCGKPATWIEAYKRWYCYSCEEYLEA